jgi:trigger factor
MVIADVTLRAGERVVRQLENVTLAARPQRVEGVALESLGDVLAGARAGERRTLEVTLPDDFDPQDLRGARATFEFTIQDIKRLKLPPLNLETLKAQGFDDEQEFRRYVRSAMESRLDEEIRRGLHAQLCKYLLEKTPLDLPEGLSARQVDRAIIRRVLDLRRRGVPQAEIDKHADELRTGARDQALTELKLYFILEKIADQFQVEVAEEDVNARISAIARHYGRRFDRVRDELAQQGGLESLYLQIRDDKCLDELLARAAVQETQGPTTSMSELADAT